MSGRDQGVLADITALPAADTGTLGKAMDVLDAVAGAPRPMRFTDLLDALAQPRGTLHRQISNLIAEGLLVQRSDNCYELGPRLLKLASRAWSGNQFRQIAEPHLNALHEATGETVHLGVLADTEIIYLDKVESRSAVRMHSQVGKASPVYCTGVGKAALSCLPDDRLGSIAHAIAYHRFTPTTLAGPEALIAEVAQIRREGLAFDREEHEAGISCVAAPISSRDGSLIAGISVTAPSYRVGMAQLEAWGPLVRRTADSISADITMRMGPRT
ncbi:MAG: IclR family transcriptional regulator [Phyllobacteriaceae bacterium]|nr:IclR family transcriptional regulator [Phyllobacteriaceae bacterium]